MNRFIRLNRQKDKPKRAPCALGKTSPDALLKSQPKKDCKTPLKKPNNAPRTIQLMHPSKSLLKKVTFDTER